MKIDREKLVAKHNPILSEIDFSSPLSVGNGEFCFTADPTGLQTLYDEYAGSVEKGGVPLCTMSQWGWHTAMPPDGVPYTEADVAMTEYEWNGRTVHYTSRRMENSASFPHSKEAYQWLRENPHRMNLATIGFFLDEKPISQNMITVLHQELILLQGLLSSEFLLSDHGTNHVIQTKTAVHPQKDALLVSVKCPKELEERLSVRIRFPYGASDITGADFSADKKALHSLEKTEWDGSKKIASSLTAEHIVDNDRYYFGLTDLSPKTSGNSCRTKPQIDSSNFFIEQKLSPGINQFCMVFATTVEEVQKTFNKQNKNPFLFFEPVTVWWYNFWKKTGIISFESSTDSRAELLEKRIILSIYLIAIQSCGSMPPQETGLLCNSWHGKFHLEMHLWHGAAMAFYNNPELLEKSFSWYSQHLSDAIYNASTNGYKGARWPKQVAYDAKNSPSPISVLLIWQQPHIIYLLDAVRLTKKTAEEELAFMNENWFLIRYTADFMADYAVYNKDSGFYELLPPVIPVQERHQEESVTNPAFEVSYWKYGLSTAIGWAEKLNIEVPDIWKKVQEKMTPPPSGNGILWAHQNCPNTFKSFASDHPSMLLNWSFIKDKRISPQTAETTLDTFLQTWDFESLWGWDFAFLAMTASRLGNNTLAMNLLSIDTPKNYYAPNGHNSQKTRTDLPAYLPGNGGLLLAFAVILTLSRVEGDKKTELAPGFVVQSENIMEYPDPDF